MSLIVPHQLPRIVERGVATTLSLDVLSAASVQQTASAGMVTVKLGSVVIVDAAAVSVGPPATYSLLASATSGEGLSDAYLEVWSLTIGGTPYVFRRPGYLVRHVFFPTIGDSDLTDRDSDLLEILPTAETTLEKYREAARKKIERDLLRKGRRPWLVFDSYDLVDAHIALTLSYIYRDLHTKIGDGRYKEEYEARQKEYQRELGSASFRYDGNESGSIDDEVATPSQGPLVLTAGPRRGRWMI